MSNLWLYRPVALDILTASHLVESMIFIAGSTSQLTRTRSLFRNRRHMVIGRRGKSIYMDLFNTMSAARACIDMTIQLLQATWLSSSTLSSPHGQ
jgi:hypothetical protein